MSETTGKAPWHLWLVGIVAVLFNFIGVFDFVMVMAQGETYMAKAGMSPAQIAHYRALPMWMMAVWAIGVWTAFGASILLLLRKKLAFHIFVASLATYLVHLLYTYVLTDGGAIMGRQMAITSAVIVTLLLFFGWYSRFMTKRGVLR